MDFKGERWKIYRKEEYNVSEENGLEKVNFSSCIFGTA